MKNERDSLGLADSSETGFSEVKPKSADLLANAVETFPFSFMNGEDDNIFDFRPIQMNATAPELDTEVIPNPKDLFAPELVSTLILETPSVDDSSDNKEEEPASVVKVSIPPKVKESGKQTS